MRKSKVLAFRHVPFEPLGSIASSLETHGIEYEYVDLYDEPAAGPPVDDAAGLIFMGGPMSVNDSLPHLQREMDHIAHAISRCTPVLGICLGAQLIAKSLGAAVYPNSRKEIGWAPVYFTESAGRDALLHGLRTSETVFHWHGETFDLPAGAELLASSDA
jgi:GMP synthase-like glutamine amidotransferase